MYICKLASIKHFVICFVLKTVFTAIFVELEIIIGL